jgi:hypothetical protein
MATKNKCGYCWQQGHNRLKCPKMAENAKNGDAWAKESLERAAIKRCSYCSDTGHNSASCDKKFNDDRLRNLGLWAVCLAGVDIIKRLRIGPGALIHGPVPYGYNLYPLKAGIFHNEFDNFETIPYVIGSIHLTPYEASSEKPLSITVETLSEPIHGKQRFNRFVSLPGIVEEAALCSGPFKEGYKVWEKSTLRYATNATMVGARILEAELFQVLQEADQEDIDKTVKEILETKPDIVDFADRVSFQKFMRKKKKSEKSEKEEI